MRFSKVGYGLVLTAAVGLGCGSSSAPAPDAGGPQPDAGNRPDAGNVPDAGPGPGQSFDTAIALTVDAAPTPTVLGGLAGKDYYKVTLTQGDRLVFITSTDAGTATNGTVIDTVLTLWSPARTQVAQDDDGWPRLSSDSTLYYLVPASGTYYVTVQECHSFLTSGCSAAAGVVDFHYAVQAFHASAARFPETNAAATQDGTLAHAQRINYAVPSGNPAGAYGDYVIDGAFRTLVDTHIFAFLPPADTLVSAGERARADFWFQPIGPNNGDGSTSNVKAWVTDSTGTHVLARASQSNFLDGDNATNGPLNLNLPVVGGLTYYLFVQNAAATSNPTTDAYFAEHYIGSYYWGQLEAEGLAGGTNDTRATAEVLVTPSGASAGSYYVDGDISPATDVDWFEADPPTSATAVSLYCQSARQGSGVVGLTAALYDATGTTVIGSIGPETLTADLSAYGIGMDAGTTKAFLRVSASSQDATNAGTSYTCSVAYQ